jgi:hypothetical protein
MAEGVRLKLCEVTEKEAQPAEPGLAQALCVAEQVCIVGKPWPVAAQPASAGAGVVMETHEVPDVPVLNAHREGQQ